MIKSVFTVAHCATFVSEAANIAENGLQPTAFASYRVGTVGITSGNNVLSIRGPGSQQSQINFTPTQAGDIVTVGLEISAGASCV